jgi:flagellar hook-associated protein 3 FlgL
MSLRITTNMMGSQLIGDLQTTYSSLANLQTEIATGRRVNQPSDDPLAAGQARLQTATLASLRASTDSVNNATTLLNAQESSLSSINDVLNRAKELAVNGANGTNSQQNRNDIADEVDQLVKSVKDAMNTQINGQYIFSGTRTDTAPYADATGDAYQGDTGAIIRQAGAGVTLQANPPITPLGATSTSALTADAVTGSGSAAGDGRVLDALETLSAHLRGGTTADINALQTTDQTAITNNISAVASARAAIGSMTNRATAATSRLSDLSDSATTSLSDLTDADLAKVMTQYTQQQSAYQAALQVGAKIVQPSLLNFLS